MAKFHALDRKYVPTPKMVVWLEARTIEVRAAADLVGAIRQLVTQLTGLLAVLGARPRSGRRDSPGRELLDRVVTLEPIHRLDRAERGMSGRDCRAIDDLARGAADGEYGGPPAPRLLGCAWRACLSSSPTIVWPCTF